VRSLLLASALVAGCGGEVSRGQPILVEHSPTAASEPANEVMPHSGARAAALRSPVSVSDGYYVGLQPPDLSTATGRTTPSLVFGPDAAYAFTGRGKELG
jgi:hypothetical protein